MQLHHHREAFTALQTIILVIGFEPHERAREWLGEGWISFPFLVDERRSVYRAYGLERSFLRSWHPSNLWFYFRRLLRGEPLPQIRADPNQLGADFIVDREGVVRLAYYSKNATDRPSVDGLLTVLRGLDPA